MSDTTSGIVLILLGLMSVIGSILNWRFVTRSGKLLNLLLGDTVARIIYVVIGVVVTLLGIAILTGLQ